MGALGRSAMPRIDAFEKMLADILEQERSEKMRIDELKARSRERSATFRQLMGNRLVFVRMLSLYREYGLIS